MMPQSHGKEGPWWAELVLIMGKNRWCRPCVMVYDIGGLLAGCLCVGLVAYVKSRAELL